MIPGKVFDTGDVALVTKFKIQPDKDLFKAYGIMVSGLELLILCNECIKKLYVFM